MPLEAEILGNKEKNPPGADTAHRATPSHSQGSARVWVLRLMILQEGRSVESLGPRSLPWDRAAFPAPAP